jgi:hypothetical protein
VNGKNTPNKDTIHIDVSVVTLTKGKGSSEDQLEKRFKSKMEKYSHITENQFFPFILSSGGLVHKKSQEILTNITNNNNESNNKIAEWVKYNIYKEISCKLQKTLADFRR